MNPFAAHMPNSNSVATVSKDLGTKPEIDLECTFPEAILPGPRQNADISS
jgi:hypothetical protein